MKRFGIATLLAFIALAVASCGKQPSPAPTPQASAPAPTSSPAPAPAPAPTPPPVTPTPPATSAPQSVQKQITVFAAASTTNVLRNIGVMFGALHDTKVVFSFASSATLAKQIKEGAPADVFLSADERWMDELQTAGLIRPESRQDLLGNELVFIAPAAKPVPVRMAKDFDFVRELPTVERIAVGDPTSVPAGTYARQSLEWLGWWDTIQSRLVPAQDVRAALRLVEMGEADAGIVYITDAMSSDTVARMAVFPPESHEPIRYPVALTSTSKDEAAAFVEFLRSPNANQAFLEAGFTLIPPPASPPAKGQ